MIICEKGPIELILGICIDHVCNTECCFLWSICHTATSLAAIGIAMQHKLVTNWEVLKEHVRYVVSVSTSVLFFTENQINSFYIIVILFYIMVNRACLNELSIDEMFQWLDMSSYYN
jgi:hypothetical protein